MTTTVVNVAVAFDHAANEAVAMAAVATLVLSAALSVALSVAVAITAALTTETAVAAAVVGVYVHVLSTKLEYVDVADADADRLDRLDAARLSASPDSA